MITKNHVYIISLVTFNKNGKDKCNIQFASFILYMAMHIIMIYQFMPLVS